MKTALLTILTMTTFSGFAMAADKSTDVKSESFAVQKMICNKTYIPATGAQSPTYQAGVDVNGNAVVPADMNPVADNAPDYIEVPMTIDLAERMGMPEIGLEGKMPVANLKLYKNGRVEYNGQDVSSNAVAMCGGDKKSDVASPSKQPVHQMESAAGQDRMMVAPSQTVNPDPKNSYQSDMVAPENTEPQAGSVVQSTTSPPPKIEYKLQRGTVNRAVTQ